MDGRDGQEKVDGNEGVGNPVAGPPVGGGFQGQQPGMPGSTYEMAAAAVVTPGGQDAASTDRLENQENASSTGQTEKQENADARQVNARANDNVNTENQESNSGLNAVAVGNLNAGAGTDNAGAEPDAVAAAMQKQQSVDMELDDYEKE